MGFDWGIALGVAGIAVGLPALVVAVPPYCQMIWGRPKLRIEFVDFTGTEGKDLMCSIFNEPVHNRFLKAVAVARETGDLNAAFDLTEEGSQRLLLRGINAFIHDATTRQSALVVRARPHFHSGFPIILCREKKTFVHDPRHQELIEVPPGHYRVRVLVVCDDKTYVVEKGLQLDPEPIRTHWI